MLFFIANVFKDDPELLSIYEEAARESEGTGNGSGSLDFIGVVNKIEEYVRAQNALLP